LSGAWPELEPALGRGEISHPKGTGKDFYLKDWIYKANSSPIRSRLERAGYVF
jgi:hypothetical protein